MKQTVGLILMALVAAGVQPTRVVAQEPPTPRIDIQVTVRHLDGSIEMFGREIAKMEIIVAPSGAIKYVHMILLSGNEKDTHLWYNYDNLAGFRYRFLAITGKGKVSIKQIGGYDVEQEVGIKYKAPIVNVDDFK